MKIITARVDNDLHARFKGWCDETGTSMQDAISGFVSKCISSKIKEAKFSKGFLRLFPFKPHEILKANGYKVREILTLLEVLEENYKKVYKKPTLTDFYGHFTRLLRIFVAKKV